MDRLKHWPIKRTLTLVILLTCSAVLLLACAGLAAYELFDFRQAMVRDTTVLADILGKNTQAALTFADEDTARSLLEALQAERHVVAARLFDRDGAPFADYTRPATTVNLPAHPAADGHGFADGHLLIFRPVMLSDKRIGTLYLQADLEGMHDRLRLFAGIAALVLLGAFLLAVPIAAWLQRPISDPIFALARTAKEIAERQDYSVRAPPQGRNEVGALTDAFNHMLAQLHAQNQALQAQLARLDLLNRTTRAIGERQDLRSIFDVVIRSLEDHLPIDFGCVCLHDAKNDVLTVERVGPRSAALTAELALREQTRVEIDQNGLSRCLRGHLVYEPDVNEVPHPFPQRLAHAGLRSFVAAPLLVESRVFGVLVAARRPAQSFSGPECEFLRHVSEHVALASHQAQLHEALQEAYDDLHQTQQAVMQQERLRALGQMASGIAHDINNAISPVALYTESLLENEKSLSPEGRDYLQTIQHAVDDVTQTVSRMREFYRQRESQLTLMPVDLNRLVDQVAGLTRARWSDMPQQRGIVIDLRRELAPALPIIMGVESEIREALTNLVFNAVDAMPEGGTLTMRTRVVDLGPADEAHSQVEVAVIDTGVGMDDATRRRCLEPFFTTKGERGTGLGLAMVYGTVQRHSALLDIESAPGRGTTITLRFALPLTEVTGTETTGQAPARPVGRLRLLIVDDDPMLIKSLRDTLEKDGHDVTTAPGGQEGIDTFQEAQKNGRAFAVVITDLGMPRVDGRRVASAIKAASPSTPVIMLTGWGERLMAEGDVPPGVDRVLNKPPKLRELRRALAEMKLQPS